MTLKRLAIACVATALLLTGSPRAIHASTDNIVLQWSAVVLDSIRQSRLGPPAVARALAIVHTCMYDAWAAYDTLAVGVHYRQKAFSATPDASRA